jgi:two-component system sensor histidine kinase/response regulator
MPTNRARSFRVQQSPYPLSPASKGRVSNLPPRERGGASEDVIASPNERGFSKADGSKQVDQVDRAVSGEVKASGWAEPASKTGAHDQPPLVDVLLVDDDVECLHATESMLASPDLNVVVASCGTKALELLDQRDFAVIILDVHMPGMDGFETAKFIHQDERSRHIPIIFFTGYGPAISQTMKGYTEGAVDYLFKPIEPEILKAKVSVFVDLQAKKQELKKRKEELEKANRELEAFSYSVSHDLSTPLRHIEGFVQLLSNRASSVLDEASLRYLKVITQSTERMGRLIDDLLEFSRMSRATISLSRVDLDQLFRETITELSQGLGDRVIDWKIGPLPEVVADRAMLHEVVVNYLTNAIKYTRKRERAEIRIGTVHNEEETIVFVWDNGVGFDMRFVDKLFCVFQRLHGSEEFEGTGIGLATVRRIIERYGGRTWAEGKVNQGATFYFSLPHLAPEPPAETDSESSNRVDAKGLRNQEF